MPPATLFTGKTLEDAVKKGLEALGLSRAEAMITVIEEGSGGFLGLGARPYRVRIMPRPGGAIREPEDREARGKRERGGRPPREGRPARGRGGERAAAPAAGRGERRPRGEDRRGRPAEGRGEPRGERRAEGRDRKRGGDQRPAGETDLTRQSDAAVAKVQGPREPRAQDRRSEARREDRDDAARAPISIEAGGAAEESSSAGPRDSDRSDDGGRRRRRRGRRGGRGRSGGGRGERNEPRTGIENAPVHGGLADEADLPMPATSYASSSESRTMTPVDEPIAATAHEPESMAPSRPEPRHERESSSPALSRPEPRRERESSSPALSNDALAAEGKKWSEALLGAMGFEASVSATAEGDRVDVVAEVATDDELLTGPKGEVRQALQHLLNRMVNRGEGSRYHLQLEINDFWQQREDELRTMALGLAEQALADGTEKLTEYLNSQERRVVHMSLRDH
ncbi:MAG TPA: Jag N-terminal domain-containing protein, partial [Candidatus Udaeobacter sp.]|nr:Jag N-terminal domain-containing protein [Candidatus Udaeobacter sp.]